MGRLSASLLCLIACTPASTSTGYTPVTSTRVPANAIVPAGQCGRGPTQTPKYTIVATQAQDDASTVSLGAHTYDCFADALVVPTSTGEVDIEAFAWTTTTYDARKADIDNATSASPPDVGALRAIPAASHVTCTATQPTGLEVVASCSVIPSGDAGPPDAASSDAASSDAASSDGGDAGPKDAAADGG